MPPGAAVINSPLDRRDAVIRLTAIPAETMLGRVTDAPATRQLQRLPFREGEPVIIVDDRGRKHVLKLRKGAQTHHGRTGLVQHDWIIGHPPGLRILAGEEVNFTCLRPTLEDYLLKVLKRHTQIIYPKDLGTLLTRANLFSGARVLEAGIGAGSAALLFRRFLGGEGELISYERRPEFARRTAAMLEEFQALYGACDATHRLEVRDVYEGIAERDLDAVLLDLPEPHRAAPEAAKALRANGCLLCWLPTVIQVFELVRHLKSDPCWTEIQTTESLVRPWTVSTQSIRPCQNMIGHTGFLISARKTLTVAV